MTGDRYVTPEEKLRDAYRRAPRVERCACGGSIMAGGSDTAVQYALDVHYATPEHLAWRHRALRAAEREAHRTATPVPPAVLQRGRRCPCGGDG